MESRKWIFIKINMLLQVTPLSSASDIVSGAYSSPCRPASVNSYSNQIGSLNFHLIFPIFGLDVDSNIAQKVVEVEFICFAF